MIELWLDVPGYEKFYTASNTGKLFSKRKKKIIPGVIDRDGYKAHSLKNEIGEVWMQRMSRIVYRTFKDELLSSDLIHHKDENKFLAAEKRRLKMIENPALYEKESQMIKQKQEKTSK